MPVPSLLTLENPVVSYDLGSTQLRYTRCPRTGIVELSCLPLTLVDRVVPQRAFDTGPHVAHLPARWQPRHAHEPEWLTPFKTSASPFVHEWTSGRSLRGNRDVGQLRLQSHGSARQPDGGLQIDTVVRAETGIVLRHRVTWPEGAPWFRVVVEAVNAGSQPITLEYLPSFSLGGITPFDSGEGVERLRLHRFRAVWSAEGRHEARLLEELNLERSWAGAGRRTERFGQRGSMPVREFFPWAALEDTVAGVFWGAQLDAPGSWHLEVSRLKDKVTLSGGLPSRDFGEWWFTLEPGASFATPEATLACVAGDLDDFCQALTAAQVPAAESQPSSEQDLPVVFNEWCSSWGEPTHDYVAATARTLAEHRLADILVIDDGWAAKPAGGDIQNNGDWIVDRKKFPAGLGATTREIRAAGLTPGLWFEYEAATEGTEAYAREELHLHRDGRVIRVGSRHFWDLRHPETEAVLAEKVIARLRDDGFGYLKIDYNDCLPTGVDGPSSPGENLRQHLLAVQRFVACIRREIPGIVIENCSSGGHRLEPSFQALCAMGSFSDAHETWSIPIIAANLHRLILPPQSQIWCVVHPEDMLDRLRYGLAACMLGRMCLSGEVKDLPPSHLDEIAAARAFYRQAAPVIRDGRSRLYREMGLSWNEPRGWQAVVRATDRQVLVVVHRFEAAPAEVAPVPLPPGTWQTRAAYACASAAGPFVSVLPLPPGPNFTGFAIVLERAAAG
jgi:alpha-galactosidase